MIRCCASFGIFAALALLVGCSGKKSPSYNPAVGPFDEDGNYIEAWADNPPKRGDRVKPEPLSEPRVASIPSPKVSPPPRPTLTPKPEVTPKPVAKPKPKPAPKPKPVKVKPKTIRHTVEKGDTLYGLSRRYGVSVSAIQKANGLSGTTIRIGKTLTIPK